MSILRAERNSIDEEALFRVLDPVLSAHGLAAVEVTFQRESGGWVLRVSIEDPTSTDLGAGVTLDRCAEVSRDLSHALDVEDFVRHAYTLEVASPGIERPLRTEAEFLRFVGRPAKVTLSKPAPDGQRVLRGSLDAVEAGAISMTVDGKTVSFPLADVREAHLVFEFGGAKAPGKKGKAPAGRENRGAKAKSHGARLGRIMATQANTGMEVHLGGILEAVAKEKGIDKKILVETIEAAILKAAQSVFGPTRELEARFNDDSGQVDLFLYMTVVEEVTTPEREIALAEVEKRGLDGALGDDLGFQIFWHPHDAGKAKQQDQDFGDLLQIKQARSQFGRIAAQTAKQVLLSRVRDAERDIIFNEYKDRQGELIKGIVRRFEKGNNIIVDLGKTEGILPAKEQTPRETYRPGDRIVALVKIIDREARGPQVILSRQDGRLVEKLFEAEVPEIYEGIVKVVGIAREPGARSKIAVTSRDSDVDPVGACVGMKGSRVQAVVQELRGEKIDIVPWDKDPAKYVIAAVQPAEVHKVIVDDADHRMELVVPDEKLSLAIGRKGQNVRLAAQLSGWRLDIISESRFKQLEDESLRALQGMEGVDEGVARAMYRAGFRTPEEIADATVEELAAIAGLSEASVGQRTKEAAEAALEARRQELLAAAKTKPEALTERERLSLLRGVGERTVESLVEGGFHSPESIVREDEARLAQRSGLSQRKAASVRAAAVQFLEGDWKAIEAARSDARRAAAAATANPLGITTLNDASSTPTPSRAAYAQPRRTCVGCGQRDDARAMVALFVEGTSVPEPGGIRVELAPPRSRPRGRGAHLHPRKACVATAAKRGLSRAFRRELRVPEATLAAAVSVGASRRAMDVLSRASRGGAVAPLGDEDEGAFLVVARDAGDVTQRPAVARAIASGRAVAMSTRAGLAACFGASRASAARTGAGAADVAALWVSGARAAEAIASACAIESTFGVVSALEDG